MRPGGITQEMSTDPPLLRIAAVILGSVLLFAAVAQLRTSSTYGLTGKGRVRRGDEPAYFWMLFVGRLFLGCALVVLGLLSP